MGSFQVSDFRAMMGKYNLGQVTVQQDSNGKQSLALVNNHAFFTGRNVVQLDGAANERLRTDFFNAIKSYMAGRGANLSDGTDASAFLAAIKEDLLGEANKQRGLDRSGDVARILDKLDVAVATGDYRIGRGENPPSLAERFVMVGDIGSQEGGNISLADTKQKRLTDSSLFRARQMLDAGNAEFDKDLVSLCASNLKLSKTQVKTYLSTRPETLLLGAKKQLEEMLAGMGARELNDLVVNLTRGDLARVALMKSMTVLHAEYSSAKGLATLTGGAKDAAQQLRGEAPFSIARLAADGGLKPLLLALGDLKADPAQTRTVRMFGVDVALSVGEDGKLMAQTGNVKFDAFGSPKVMLATLENSLTLSGDDVDVRKLAALMDDPAYVTANAEGERRMRLVATAVVHAKTGLGEQGLQCLEGAALHELARAVAQGRVDVQGVNARIKELAANQMYSADMVGQIRNFENADVADKVGISNKRQDGTPALNKFAADLFCNDEPWMFDTTKAVKGMRVAQTVRQHADVVAHLLEHPEDLDNLDFFGGEAGGVVLKHPILQLLNAMRESGVADADGVRSFCDDPNNLALMDCVETSLNLVTEQSIQSIQNKFSALMSRNAGNAGDKPPLWKQSLDEVIESQKNAQDSVEGQFFRKIVTKYLEKSAPQEKRMMLASLLRCGQAGQDESKMFGALLKGAGPIFHKIMQGVPENEIPPAMRGAFADMKTNLAPIPEKVVLSNLLRIVEGSENRIASIALKATLGSASVGQAFLCEVTEADGTKRNCVVKMLKPDVHNRFLRESDLMCELAQEAGGDGFLATFKSRLATISAELNFKSETDNVKLGNVYNGKVPHVHSVELYPGIAAEMDMMVLTVAEGDTVDGFLKKTADGTMARVRQSCKYLPVNNSGEVARYQAPSLEQFQRNRTELANLLGELKKRQQLMVGLAKNWFDEAVFGGGFFHGDLHSGNIMATGTDITVIDYGNAMKLKPEEQKLLKGIICCATAGDVDVFVKRLNELVKLGNGNNETLLDDEDQAAEYKDFLKEIFSKGGIGNSDARLLAAVNELQRRGAEIPGAVYNFLLSQNRLKNSMDAVVAKIEEVQGLLAQMSIDNDLLMQASDVGRGVMEFKPEVKLLLRNSHAQALIPTFDAVTTTVAVGCGKSYINCVNSAAEKLTPQRELEAVQKFQAEGAPVENVLLPAVRIYGEFCKGLGEAAEEDARKLADALAAWNAPGAQKDAKQTAVKNMVEALFAIQRRMVEQSQAAYELEDFKDLGGAIYEVITDRLSKMGKGELIAFGWQIGGFQGKAIADALMTGKEQEEHVKNRERDFLETILTDGGRYQVSFGVANSFVPLLSAMANSARYPRYRQRAKDFKLSRETKLALQRARLGDPVHKKGPEALTEAEMKKFVKELAFNLANFNVEDMKESSDIFASFHNKTMRGSKKITTLEEAKAAYTDPMAMGNFVLSRDNYVIPLIYLGNVYGRQVVDAGDSYVSGGGFEALTGNQTLTALMGNQEFLAEVVQGVMPPDEKFQEIAAARLEDYLKELNVDPATLDNAAKTTKLNELAARCKAEYADEMSIILRESLALCANFKDYKYDPED